MKTRYFLSLLLASIGFAQTNTSAEPDVQCEHPITILSLNTWHAGAKVSNGLDKLADVVIETDADVVAFSETWPKDGFPTSLLTSLANKGVTNYFGRHAGGDVSLISRFPILETHTVFDQTSTDSGSIIAYRLQLPSGHPLTVCVAHLDYTWYALNLPRGYNGGSPNWAMIDENPADGIPDYVNDVSTICNYDLHSKRDEAIAAVITFSAPLTLAGEDVVLAGDFNFGSHLDWVDSTRDLFGHNHLVIPWNNSTVLATNGWVDSYREVHPNPATHPGITWPSEAFASGSTSWTPKSDERDRIDFIYYNRKNLKATDAAVVGSRTYYVFNKKMELISADPFLLETIDWPTDHKGVRTTFKFIHSKY